MSTSILTQQSRMGERRDTGMIGILVILGALSAFAPFATDMYLAGFSDIAITLGTGVDKVQWSLSAFFVGLAVGQLFYGPLVDRFGRRKPLLAGVFVFVLSSVLAVFAPDVETFIGVRFLQAVGGCSGMIISRTIIQDLSNEREAARALSLMMMIQGVGPIIAPVMGSYLLVAAGWHAVFVFLAVFGALCLISAWKYLPETMPVEQRRSQTSGRIIRIFVIMLRRRAFIVPVLSSGFAVSSMFVFICGSPFIFINLYDISKEAYGWLFGANAVGLIFANQLNCWLLRRFSVRSIYIGALFVNVAAGMVLLAVAGTTSLAVLVVPLFICLATVPITGANGVAMAMAMSGRYAGSASSLVGVLQFSIIGAVSTLVGILHNGTVYPMIGLILTCGVLAGGTFFLGKVRG